MGFDSTLHNTIDAQLTPKEFKDRLEQLVQPILDQRFPDSLQKRKVAPHHDRVSFACPYCGDSMKLAHAKRGNFILDGKHRNFFKCHNCGMFKRIDSFFKDFNTTLKLDAVNYVMDNLGDFKTLDNSKYDMSVFMDMEKLDKYAIDRQEILTKFGLVEVKGTPVWSWLTNRLQYQEDKFLYSPEKNYVLILNLTRTGKVIGAQRRLFKGANRFQTYKLSKLYAEMDKVLDCNEEQIEYLDTISMIFNICLINFSNPITLFEGPMDAFLFKNSIANTGANKEIPIDIPVRYFYDWDETGRKKSFQHLNKEEEVFLWEKLQRDMEFPYRNKWDLNDIFIYFKQNNIQIPLFDNYFSSDPLDAMDI